MDFTEREPNKIFGKIERHSFEFLHEKRSIFGIGSRDFFQSFEISFRHNFNSR